LSAPSDDRGLARRNAVIAYAPMLIVSRPRKSVSASPEAASIGQQHEREQSSDLRVVRLQLVDDPSQAHRLMREIGSPQMGSDAARVALVENQVQHV